MARTLRRPPRQHDIVPSPVAGSAFPTQDTMDAPGGRSAEIETTGGLSDRKAATMPTAPSPTFRARLLFFEITPVLELQDAAGATITIQKLTPTVIHGAQVAGVTAAGMAKIAAEACAALLAAAEKATGATTATAAQGPQAGR